SSAGGSHTPYARSPSYPTAHCRPSAPSYTSRVTPSSNGTRPTTRGSTASGMTASPFSCSAAACSAPASPLLGRGTTHEGPQGVFPLTRDTDSAMMEADAQSIAPQRGASQARILAPVVESGALAGGSPQVVDGIEVPSPWWGACWRVHEAPAAQRPPD